MSECEFCHPENYCVYEDKCEHRGELRKCKAKPEDLVEVCIDCGKAEAECECNE